MDGTFSRRSTMTTWRRTKFWVGQTQQPLREAIHPP